MFIKWSIKIYAGVQLQRRALEQNREAPVYKIRKRKNEREGTRG